MSSEIVSHAELLARADSFPSPWPSCPTVSLILVSLGPCAELRRALAQLAAVEKPCSEILVICPGPLPADMRALLVSARARHVEADPGQSMRELRQLGASQASGQVVVIREAQALIGCALFNRFGARASVERQVPVRTESDRPSVARAAPARAQRAAKVLPDRAHP
jgi:hypothetical protein